MKIFALLFCLLFLFSCQKTEPTPEIEEMEDVQEMLVFDDIVGKMEELNHAERDIFFLYLNAIEDQAFEISLPLAEEWLRKNIEEQKQKKADEEASNADTVNDNEEKDDSVPAENTSEEENNASENSTQEEEDSDEPDLWWVHQYAKQLVRDNWKTIFENVKKWFPNIDFTGFEEYSPSDWDDYRRKLVEEFGPDAINDVSPEEKKLYWERYYRLFPEQ